MDKCVAPELPPIPIIDTDTASDFLSHSILVEKDDEILLYEFTEPRKKHLVGAYYWTILEADAPLFVCSLDKYAQKDVRWNGRKSDYLVIGSFKGKCYVVILELRKQVTHINQYENKKEQITNSAREIIRLLLPEFQQSYPPASVCEGQAPYILIGVVIPSVASKSRAEQSTLVDIDGYPSQVPIVTIPNSRIIDCRISWSGLLETIVGS